VTPFRGKALIEVSLDLVEQGLVVSLQDCGAAGLASSLSEMARDGMGVDVHLDRVPLREDDMEPWEIMISESSGADGRGRRSGARRRRARRL
jgi:phosphoribosylformylglycinamidine synthase